MNQLKKIRLIFSLLFAPILAVGILTTEAYAVEVMMYKNARCDCCGAWAKHMENQGFTVKEIPRDDMSMVKEKYGVPDKLASCHTAIVDGYVIEGHVPASDVLRLLKERPKVVGLTAPGMPMQSPGMQAEEKAPKNYDVLAFDKRGHTQVFEQY